MRTTVFWSEGKWKPLRYACAGFVLATAMMLFPSQGPQWAGQKAEADQIKSTHEERKGLVNAAYVFDGKGLTFPQSTAASLTQLNFSFALIKDGKVSGTHWQGIGAFTKFIAANPHIKPILSVGGWGADGFSQAAASEAGRELFVESALALMEKHGFLGIDIDWEYPGSSAAGIVSSVNDKENFTLLLQALRNGLDHLTAKDGKSRMLCIAVGADRALTGKMDCVAVGKLVDQVNLMTYDMQLSSVVTHHANLFTGSSQYPASADSAVRDYASAGIPKSKMMLGAAFYGRPFQTTSTVGNGLYQPAGEKVKKYYSYAMIKAMLESGESKRYYDEKAQAPYLFDGKFFISYDDPESITRKGNYAKANGLMGMMCWEYGGDANGELLRAMYESTR